MGTLGVADPCAMAVKDDDRQAHAPNTRKTASLPAREPSNKNESRTVKVSSKTVKGPVVTPTNKRTTAAGAVAESVRVVPSLPVRPPLTRRSEKVSESVAREIIRNSTGLPPGSTLPAESSMLEQYGVSRGSLREALRILEVQGLIVMKPGPGGGPVLRGPESAVLGKTQTLFFHLLGARYRDLIDGRREIEPILVALAARRADREALEPLRVFLEPKSPTKWSDPQYLREASGFHTTVTALCGNLVLSTLCHSLHDITLFRLRDAGFSDADRLGVLQDHAAIAKAVLDGNAKKAERLMREHMALYSNQVLAHHAGLMDEIIDWH